jgi:outer membrane cobalamin receptor
MHRPGILNSRPKRRICTRRAWSIRSGRASPSGLTAYRSDARNFIERPQGAPLFLNAARYRLQGVEVEAALRAAHGLLIRGRYTYLDAQDRTPGREGTPL